jgi:hypothetical protein
MCGTTAKTLAKVWQDGSCGDVLVVALPGASAPAAAAPSVAPAPSLQTKVILQTMVMLQIKVIL